MVALRETLLPVSWKYQHKAVDDNGTVTIYSFDFWVVVFLDMLQM